VSNGDDVASDKSVDELLPCFSPIKPEQMQGVRTYRIHESKVRT
jgi:hypothetical protein